MYSHMVTKMGTTAALAVKDDGESSCGLFASDEEEELDKKLV